MPFTALTQAKATSSLIFISSSEPEEKTPNKYHRMNLKKKLKKIQVHIFFYSEQLFVAFYYAGFKLVTSKNIQNS